MNMPEHYSPIMPYVILPGDAEGFIAFLKNVFAAQEILCVRHDSGEVMHAEFSIYGGTIMFGVAGGEWKAFPCGIFVVTDDVDGMYARALENSATACKNPATKAMASPPDSRTNGATNGGRTPRRNDHYFLVTITGKPFSTYALLNAAISSVLRRVSDASWTSILAVRSLYTSYACAVGASSLPSTSEASAASLLLSRIGKFRAS